MYKLIKYEATDEKLITKDLLKLYNLALLCFKPFETFNKTESNEINQYVIWASDKMLKFYLSINEFLNPEGPPFTYEAKIITRSMLEHLININYIFKNPDIIYRESKIERFKEYSKNVMPFKHAYDMFCNKSYGLKYKNEDSLNEVQKIYKQSLIEENERYNFESNINNFKAKYNSNNIKSWNGGSVRKLFEIVFETQEHGIALYRVFYKIYDMYSNYTHSAMPYETNTGFLVATTEGTAIEILYFANLFYYYSIKQMSLHFNISSIEIKNYINKFNEIEKKYKIKF